MSCDHKGYLDAKSYPFVDAQLVFCGLVNKETKHRRLNVQGLIALTYAKPCASDKQVSLPLLLRCDIKM